MRDKFIKAEYNPETGISICKIATKWGVFENQVHVKEEDKDIANQWDGIKFAEYLCMIDKFKAKGRFFQERANGIKHVLNISKDNTDNTFMLERQYTLMMKESAAYYAMARKYKENYPEFVKKVLTERRKIREKVANKKNNQ